jgi:hypothetical protein
MANALESASLVMIPSGYEDGTLGSLKPTDGTGDFTFSRGSNTSATRVNADGYIEKGYENLLLQSNSFDTTWANINSTETSGQQGYDGSNDAWLLEKSAANGFIYQSISTSGVQALSIYAKQNSANSIRFLVLASSGSAEADYNLSTGVVDSTSPSIIGSANIEDVGNGWYRCSFSVSFSSTTQLRIYPAENGSTSASSGSVYIQDAMLNQGLVAYPYIETTTAPVAGGILEDMPRLDYSNGSCPALLLEPSRTNLVPSSEYLLSIPWNSNTLTFNWETSIINLEGYYGTQEAIGIGNAVYNDMASAVNIGDKLCYSIWAKSSSNANFKFGGLYGGEHATFNVSTGTLVAQGPRLDSYEVIDYGNGWRRYIIVISYSGAGGNKAYGHIEWNDASEPIYLYGFQLEQDATYETSYIPTYGVSQTRLQDSATASNVTSLIGQTEGTLFMDCDNLNFSSDVMSFFPSAGSVYGSGVLIFLSGSDLRFFLFANSTNSIFTTNFVNGGRNKIAMTYTSTAINAYVNGVKVGTSTSAAFPQPLNEIRLGSAQALNPNKEVNQALVFPTALTDSECIELTTI